MIWLCLTLIVCAFITFAAIAAAGERIARVLLAASDLRDQELKSIAGATDRLAEDVRSEIQRADRERRRALGYD